jgi:F-type H+-transporting ATPase subunit gamma
MATLKTIRKRITSVKNTQKITKAMKMVAAAKLRRTQSALMQARPHARLLQESVTRLVGQADAWGHPLLMGELEPKKADILVMTSDRGLCGGFNSNLLRKVEQFLRHEGRAYEQIQLSTIGRKGRDYYRAKRRDLKDFKSLKAESFSFMVAEEMAQDCITRFLNKEFEVFYLAFNSFKSAISQEPTIRQILPIPLEFAEMGEGAPVVWEGSSARFIDQLLPRYVATQFFLAVLESNASELGARMSAMENATNNAKDMIYALTLQYNRARQASITKELMDIVNGAEALK